MNNNAAIYTRSERILDFAIVGFEKTGTTFLLKALSSHPEVVMPIKHSELSKKLCVKKDSGKVVLLDWLNEQHDKEVILRDSRELISDTNKQQHRILKHGMKCSDLLRKSLAIENLADLSDQTRLIVGLRGILCCGFKVYTTIESDKAMNRIGRHQQYHHHMTYMDLVNGKRSINNSRQIRYTTKTTGKSTNDKD